MGIYENFFYIRLMERLLLLVMCDYSVSKIEFFKEFFPYEIFQNFRKALHLSDLLFDIKISNYHFSAKYC